VISIACPLRSFLRSFLSGVGFVWGAAASAAEPLSYNRDIRPFLSENCFDCHGPDKAKQEGRLRLDVREIATQPAKSGSVAIVPGKPEASEALMRILASDPEEQMPPPASGHTLTAAQKDLVRQWINEGAAYQRHWAFEPIRKAPATGNAIDFFIRQRLQQAGLQPSPAAAPETQLRRVSLDLTGLPPTGAEASAFLADASQRGLDAAYDAAVDRLLKSPRYGERMAWTWLEAARYADTDGYQNDGPREMWRWRDWVIDAFNTNLPFDQFTIEQLAGDLLPKPTHEQLIATGFNRNNRYNSEEGIPIDEFLLENAVDRVDTTSTVWMGLTAGCARCHDHKYDPLSQKEYYQLIDYFNDVAESGRATRGRNSEPWIKTPTTISARSLPPSRRRRARPARHCKKQNRRFVRRSRRGSTIPHRKVRRCAKAWISTLPSTPPTNAWPRKNPAQHFNRACRELRPRSRAKATSKSTRSQASSATVASRSPSG
jgi:mono/diheme cytochrome c family protein